MESLEETWRHLQKIIGERDGDLRIELTRQQDNDTLRSVKPSHHSQSPSFTTFLCRVRGEITPSLSYLVGGAVTIVSDDCLKSRRCFLLVN